MLLKSCVDVLSKPLFMIFQKSFEEGKLPQDWKLANISPTFKKSEKTESENYQPVSLTSVPSKVMESIIRDKIVKDFEKNNLYNAHQHDFIKTVHFWLRPYVSWNSLSPAVTMSTSRSSFQRNLKTELFARSYPDA